MTPRKLSTTAEELIPERPTLASVRKAAATCRACPLWKLGTQTVFGEGPKNAEILLIGEQPGNEEDLSGQPFVGPAGKLLDGALEKAGIDRDRAYLTNVVKHFKWEPRGKRRIHKKPNGAEIRACSPWLDVEIELVKPSIIVCLGATAAQTLLGKDFRVTLQRGRVIRENSLPPIIATVHPSSILRAPDETTRKTEMRRFISDLKKAAVFVGKSTR
jgi:DNA polymerase